MCMHVCVRVCMRACMYVLKKLMGFTETTCIFVHQSSIDFPIFFLKESSYFSYFFNHVFPIFLNNHAAEHPVSFKIELMLLIYFN